MKGASFSKAYTIFIIVTLLLIGVVSWAGDGAVVFHSPTYPFRVLIWGDDEGSGLTVALKENFDPLEDRTLDDAVEIYLPESARHFTPLPVYPDTFKTKGVDVPVAVYNYPFWAVYWAYYDGEEDEIAGYIEAIGLVKVHWTGKAFKSLSYSAIGPVEYVPDGDEALLVATGHELYENGVVIMAYDKVDLH